MQLNQNLYDLLKDYFLYSNDAAAIQFRTDFKREYLTVLNADDGNDTLLYDELPPLDAWLDNQDVMQLLHISPRTLQTMRSNHTLHPTRIMNKFYYNKNEIRKLFSENAAPSKSHNHDNTR